MDRIKDLAIFAAVVETGSMSAAAARLETTPAQISKRIQLLEETLGIRLLHRTTRRLTPTTQGELFFERCKTILDEVGAARAEISTQRQEAAGLVKLTAPASFGRQHVAPALPEFLARHPQVQLHLLLTDAVVDLVDQGLDLAIRIGSAPDSNLVAHRLAANRCLLCASPDYLARHGTPLTPDDLRRHNCLLLASPGTTHQFWQLQRDGQAHKVRVAGNLVANNGEVLGDAAAAGLGIAIKSTWDVGQRLRDGLLVPVLPDYTLSGADILALTPHRRHLALRVRLLIEFLQIRFAGVRPYWDDEE